MTPSDTPTSFTYPTSGTDEWKNSNNTERLTAADLQSFHEPNQANSTIKPPGIIAYPIDIRYQA